jgi:hypothetical protein
MPTQDELDEKCLFQLKTPTCNATILKPITNRIDYPVPGTQEIFYVAGLKDSKIQENINRQMSIALLLIKSVKYKRSKSCK